MCVEGRLSERVTEIRRLGADCDENLFVSLRISASAETKIDLRRSAELKDRSSAQSTMEMGIPRDRTPGRKSSGGFI